MASPSIGGDSPIIPERLEALKSYAKENKLTFIQEFLEKTDLATQLDPKSIEKASRHFMKRMFSIPSTEQRLKENLRKILTSSMPIQGLHQSGKVPDLLRTHKVLIENLNKQLGGEEGRLQANVARAKNKLAAIDKKLDGTSNHRDSTYILESKREAARLKVSRAEKALASFNSPKNRLVQAWKSIQKNLESVMNGTPSIDELSTAVQKAKEDAAALKKQYPSNLTNEEYIEVEQVSREVEGTRMFAGLIGRAEKRMTEMQTQLSKSSSTQQTPSKQSGRPSRNLLNDILAAEIDLDSAKESNDSTKTGKAKEKLEKELLELEKLDRKLAQEKRIRNGLIVENQSQEAGPTIVAEGITKKPFQTSPTTTASTTDSESRSPSPAPSRQLSPERAAQQKSYEFVVQNLDYSLSIEEERMNPITFLKMKKSWNEFSKSAGEENTQKIEARFKITERIAQLEQQIRTLLDTCLTDPNKDPQYITQLREAWNKNPTNAREVDKTFQLSDKLRALDLQIQDQKESKGKTGSSPTPSSETIRPLTPPKNSSPQEIELKTRSTSKSPTSPNQEE